MLSFWEKEFFNYSNTLIVGSGLTGLHTALELKKKDPDRNIVMVDRSGIPKGASTKNAGFACFGSVTELLEDLENMEEDQVVDLVQKRWEGLQKMKLLVSTKDMDYKPFGGFELIEKDQEYALDKIDWINELIEPIFEKEVFCQRQDLIDRFGLNPETVNHLIYNPFEAQLNPFLLVNALIQQCKSLGIRFLTGVQVKSIEGSGPYSVLFQNELKLETSQVILCTNAYSDMLTNVGEELEPGRGQVIITNAIENLKIKGVFHWESGYYYFRNYKNRLLIGGGRNLDKSAEATTENGLSDLIQKDLEKRLRDVILPNVDFEIEHRWSGIMAFGKSKMPRVEVDTQNMIVGAGLNGMGVALSAKIGEEIAHLALNQSS